ncbi:MJ1255/VC2487 family glycosyltransferase [Brumicola blandensis]|uniref:Glycosyltransferase family protein n=1 Tax=Brumicola blandensis TaxID=3075611 RepID=A0AAW8QYT4_9ALTE|nr:MJ1255/VC2487 family glycosyltransferase [Alteromonas sp. W409]MDT0582192.1 glycosyltransferase family protein [Alteromonas sp. W409]
MKILYGIQGTGNGHIARARLMAEAFNKRSEVHVDYLFTGRDKDAYFDMQVFNEYSTRTGLSFVTENGALHRFKTLKQAKLFEFMRDVNKLDLSGYDLVLNDFEPVSAWAAKKQKVPSLSISHQAAFNYSVPTEAEGVVDKIITKHFAPTDFALGVHWYHFNQAIIPPFVPAELACSADIEAQPFVLVYLPFETTMSIQQALAPLSETTFYCYHPEVKTPYIDKNVHWFPPSKDGFHHALMSCSRVIANGGFELATECLSLGKALLMKPLNGQFEQFSNAFTLRQLGLSDTLFALDTDNIEEWLTENRASKIKFPSNINRFIDWILAGNWSDTQGICQELWQEVEFPSEVSKKFSHI